MYILVLFYARTAVVVVADAHNSRHYTDNDIRVHIKGTYFAKPASPPTTLG